MGSIHWLLSTFAYSPGFEMKGCFLLSGGRPIPRVGCMQMWKTELLRRLRGAGTGRESRVWVLARSSVLAGQSRGRASLPLGIWGAGPSTAHVVCGTVDGGRSGPTLRSLQGKEATRRLRSPAWREAMVAGGRVHRPRSRERTAHTGGAQLGCREHWSSPSTKQSSLQVSSRGLHDHGERPELYVQSGAGVRIYSAHTSGRLLNPTVLTLSSHLTLGACWTMSALGQW